MKTEIVIANSLGITRQGKYLIHSPSRWSETVDQKERHFVYYPFFLGYLSSLLKKYTDFSVRMVDGCLSGRNGHSYLSELQELKPSFLVMEPASLVYRENLEVALALKKEVGTRLLFAGPHASLFPIQVLKEGVDDVFTGQYDQSLLDFFCRKNFNTGQHLWPSLKNISFQDYPWPEDSDVSRLAYALPGEPSSDFREIQIYASRGCGGRCGFCVAKQVYYPGRAYENRRPHDVLSEMLHLKKKYPELEGFFFDEEDHFGNPGFNRELAELLAARGAPFHIEALGRIQGVNDELFPLLKKAGYYKLRVGVESLDADIQRRLGTKVNREAFERFAVQCRNHGFDLYASFQVGLPGSTAQKDLETLSFLKRYLKKGWISNLQVSLFTPFPGTPFFHLLKKQDGLESFNFEDYNGGKQSVVNWKGYSHQEMEKVFEAYLETRDHIQLVRRVKNFSAMSWVAGKIKKHGFRKSIEKVSHRLKSEWRYFSKKITAKTEMPRL